MGRMVGTTSRGIRTPIIRGGDDLVKIVADSSCDIRDLGELAKGILIEYVPLKIIVGDKEFVDDKTIDVRQMYDALYVYDGKTSTTCPSPDDYLRAYEGADEIYVVTISSNLSGSYNSANLAKDMYLEEHPEAKICVIDSLSTSGTMVLAMRKICELVQSSTSFENISKLVIDYIRNHTNLVFALHNVSNLVRNGRLNKLVGSAINMLGIKIVGRASTEGTLEPFSKVRGSQKVIKCFLKEFDDYNYKGGKVVMSHAQNETDVQELKKALLEKYPEADIEIIVAKGLVSYYAEEKGILVAFEY